MMLEKMVTTMVGEFVSDAKDGAQAASRICSVCATAMLTLMAHTVPDENKSDPAAWLDPQELWDALGAIVVPILDRDRFAEVWEECERARETGEQPNIDMILGPKNPLDLEPLKRLMESEPDEATSELEALFSAPAFGEDFGETVPDGEEISDEEPPSEGVSDDGDPGSA
jgi:hypothetical protein